MYKSEIIEAISNATDLVLRFTRGELDIPDLVKEYGSFYYYAALDGHEANEDQKKVLRELKHIIAFHEKVQCEVVDLTYLGNDEDRQQYLDAGRIEVSEADTRLRELVERYDPEAFLNRLK